MAGVDPLMLMPHHDDDDDHDDDHDDDDDDDDGDDKDGVVESGAGQWRVSIHQPC